MTNRGKWVRPEPTLDGLLSKTIPEPNSGCLLWLGPVNQFGYGRASIKGRKQVAHRAVYEMACGPVPDGLELDHLCRVRCCVNVAHLEPVTKQVNGLRGMAGVKSGAMQRAKTHCPEGHPYSGANLFLRSSGRRECRTCMRARNRRTAA
jgi:hypothetical protein